MGSRVLRARHALAALLLAITLPVHADNAAAQAAATPDGPALSLQQAISRALAHNPDLAVLPFKVGTRRARADAAALRPAPSVSAEVENLLGRGALSGVKDAQATFAISQVIELGDQRQRRVDAARSALATLDVDRRIAQLDVVAEVGRRFIHVAADEKQLALTRLSTALAEKTVAEVQRRMAVARAPEVALNRARITLARAGVAQEHAEHELLTSRRKLAAMWGARSDDDFGAVAAELFELPAVEDDDQLMARLANSPDFLRYASEARQRDAEIRLAEAKANASITVSAGVRWLNARDDAGFVGGVSVPLFGGRRAQPSIAEARAQRAATDVAREAAQIKAEASLFELVQELRHSITESQVLRDEVLPQMQAALEATEAAWQRGRYSDLEWLDAQRERIDIERALIRSSANAHLFRVEIERLTGGDTTLMKSGVSR